MFIMMLTQSVVDYYTTYIKYSEGFMYIPTTGKVIQKPFTFWSASAQDANQPLNYLQCVTFAFHTSVFFLMQCFWNYLSNSVAKKSFMGSFEFKFYIIWALASVAMFPILQWTYRDDIYYGEAVPQLAYGLEVLITACLGIRSHFRFKRIISFSKRNKSSSTNAIVNRIAYFKEMNSILTATLFSYGASFVILCADGLTTEKVVNTSKFATDLLIANVNMCMVFLWLMFISIFHPRRNLNSPSGPGSTGSDLQSKSNIEMSSHIHSQRVTKFVTNSDHFATTSAGQPISPISYNDPVTGNAVSGGVFMRPMAPVEVEPPHSISVVEDPYTSQSVTFSMVNPPATSSIRYGTPVSEYPSLHSQQHSNNNYF
ncbi:hypothetical protein BX666DRAFT_555180 [Dichotomocladium elegans]|nr:hypothetical protein BX666DRAFT_555180 [Dichotomocladium elegans]